MFFLPDRPFYFTPDQQTTRSHLDTSACEITEKNCRFGRPLHDIYLYIVVDFLRRDGMTSSDWPKMQVEFILKALIKLFC